MNTNVDTWQIIHIPENPHISPDQQPTVNVFAAVVEPKLVNVLVRRLNQIAPLESLRHVKRVQKKCIDGTTQLAVILCQANENDSHPDSIPHNVRELIHCHQLSAFITKFIVGDPARRVLLSARILVEQLFISVDSSTDFLSFMKLRLFNVCKEAASSKEQWEEQCKLWPTSYHPPTYKIDGVVGFSEEDRQSVISFMKFAVELAKYGDDLVVNAAVIVDPSVKQIIASACDETYTRNTPGREPCFNNCSSRFDNSELPSNGCLEELNQNHSGVSCLYPWQWDKQPSHMDNLHYWHPLRHAAMVAIESSAARDRKLFPGYGETVELSQSEASSGGSSSKRQKINLKNAENDENITSPDESASSLLSRPYLCTGYDMYLVWEPCVMCAMALVHQRMRRIFYAYPNPNAGALSSVYRLQGEKSLNHHYAVFRVLLPEP